MSASELDNHKLHELWHHVCNKDNPDRLVRVVASQGKSIAANSERISKLEVKVGVMASLGVLMSGLGVAALNAWHRIVK